MINQTRGLTYKNDKPEESRQPVNVLCRVPHFKQQGTEKRKIIDDNRVDTEEEFVPFGLGHL